MPVKRTHWNISHGAIGIVMPGTDRILLRTRPRQNVPAELTAEFLIQYVLRVKRLAKFAPAVKITTGERVMYAFLETVTFP
jgi:hypothetical protein